MDNSSADPTAGEQNGSAPQTPGTPNSTSQPFYGQPSPASQVPPLNSENAAAKSPNPKHAHRFIFVYVLLLIVAAGAGSFITWRYHDSKKPVVTSAQTRHQSVSSKPTPSFLTFVDSQRVYSLEFPSTWAEANRSSNGLGSGTPVDTLGASFINSSDETVLSVRAYYGSLNKVFVQQFAVAGSPITISAYPGLNAYPALYASQTSGGLTNEYYAVYHNGVTVAFSITVSQSALGGTSAYNYSAYLPAVKQIIDSISFSVPPAARDSQYFSLSSSTPYLQIPQLGLKLPDPGLSGLYYVWYANSAYVFDPTLDALANQQSPSTCATGPVTVEQMNTSSDNYQWLGSISKGFAGPETQLNIIQLNGSYYDLHGASGGCDANQNQSLLNLLDRQWFTLTKDFSEAQSY